MDERHEFVAVEEHAAPAALPQKNVFRVLMLGVSLVAKRDKLVARGIRKLRKGSSDRFGDLPSFSMDFALRGDSDHGGEKGASNLLLGQACDLRSVGEERPPLPIRDGANHALGPWMTRGLEENLEQAKFLLLDIGQCPHRGNMRIHLESPEGTQREHELLREAEIHYHRLPRSGQIPSIPKKSARLGKHGFGKVSDDLLPKQRKVLFA